MHDAQEFLKALTTVLCVAAVTTVVFQRLRQPVVLGYILAGLIIGPHVRIPLVADPAIIETLSELGVILLMFSLGLEFSLQKLFRVGLTAGLTAIVQCSIMSWLGFFAGRLFGWTTQECLFTGALIAISSTTIIAKAFDEQGITGKLREVVVGVLIVEDLIAILLLAALTAISSGTGLSAGAIAITTGRLAAFLIGLLVVGILLVPRTVRAINRLNRPETTLVASIGFCFAVALLAQTFGYSIALGAFIAGSLIAESGEEKKIEHLVRPVRDMFGAIFFVSVGMLIDPRIITRHWIAVAVLTVVVVVGKIVSVSLGAFLTGAGTRTSIQSGMSLAQIGEFSFIIAGLGLSLKATGEFLYPVAVAVSALTTLITPFLIRASGPFANWVDRKLPVPLQTFAALYGSWVERLRVAPQKGAKVSAIRRLLRLLLIDAVLLSGLIIGTFLSIDAMAAAIQGWAGISLSAAKSILIGVAIALSIPFCAGIVQIAQKLGVALAERALPKAKEGKMDPADAPRRALVVTLGLGSVLLIGAPILAVTQPFLPGFYGAFALLITLASLAVVFWQRATNLQGHVRAGAQIIIEALAAQSQRRETDPDPHSLEQVHLWLPGLGEPVPVRLTVNSEAVGRTLSELNLRGLTGATVLAISRGNEGVLVPTAKELLQAGDVLALAGTQESIDAAKALLAMKTPH